MLEPMYVQIDGQGWDMERLGYDGYRTALFSSHGEREFETEALDSLRSLRPSGVLLAPLGRISDSQAIASFCEDVPTVILDRDVDGVHWNTGLCGGCCRRIPHFLVGYHDCTVGLCSRYLLAVYQYSQNDACVGRARVFVCQCRLPGLGVHSFAMKAVNSHGLLASFAACCTRCQRERSASGQVGSPF